MTDRITTNGKQVLLDGRHIADAVSSEVATAIASSLRAGPIVGALTPVPARLWQSDPITGTTCREVNAETDGARVEIRHG